MTRAARTFESLPVLYPVIPEWDQAYPAAKTVRMCTSTAVMMIIIPQTDCVCLMAWLL